MKFYLITIFILFISVFGISQEDRSGGKSYKYQPNLGNGVFRELEKDKKIEGTPYLNNNFTFVKVENVEENSKMRYNIFKDEFEFISVKNDTLILDKNENFKNLNFVSTNTNYKLLNYLNQNDKFYYGYLIDIHQKNNFGLYKKENTALTDEKIAKTTLEQNKLAKYYKTNDDYFIKNNDKISEFPSNKKRLIKIFPEKKEVIEAFLKENKIEFSKDSDKIKIINFLASIFE